MRVKVKILNYDEAEYHKFHHKDKRNYLGNMVDGILPRFISLEEFEIYATKAYKKTEKSS